MTRIIIGIDGRDRSRDALAFGRTLAASGGAAVTVAHVYPWEPADALRGSHEFHRHLRAEAEGHLVTAVDELRNVRDVATAALGDHSPARALQHLAAELGAGLVVVGSSHTGRLGRVVPGSTAERLLHGAPCPVAVVPAGYAEHGPHAPHVVAASWDGGAPADAALAAAEDIARGTSSVLRVVRVHAPAYAAAYPPALGADYVAEVAHLREHVRTALDERVAAVGPSVRAEAVLLEGDPVDALVGISAEADLLVMGSRGYGPLRAVLLGGVSAKVIRSAACPVIVVPNGAAVAAGSVFAPHSGQPT